MSTAGTPAWDRLPSSALVCILRRLPLKDRFLAGPFVCRAWADAARNPQCWESMLPDGESPELHFMKRTGNDCQILFPPVFSHKEVRAFILRSQGCATTVYLPVPTRHTHETINYHVNLSYIAESCPKLKHLYVQTAPRKTVQTSAFRKLMYLCKDVELLALVYSFKMTPSLMGEMRQCWPKLRGLTNYFDFHPVGLTAIATNFPKLQFLGLTHGNASVESLEIILKGCSELKFLKILGMAFTLVLEEEDLRSDTSGKVSAFLRSDPFISDDSDFGEDYESESDFGDDAVFDDCPSPYWVY